MTKNILWALLFIIAAGLLQSTFLSYIAPFNTVPDLALGILVFAAYVNGTMSGQVTGFFSGFLLDFLSASPLGYNSLVRTLIGALAGLMKGTFYLDRVFLPISLCAGATIIKIVCCNLLHLIFSDTIPAYDIMLPGVWVELGLNAFTAPFLFAILRAFKNLLINERKP